MKRGRGGRLSQKDHHTRKAFLLSPDVSAERLLRVEVLALIFLDCMFGNILFSFRFISLLYQKTMQTLS